MVAIGIGIGIGPGGLRRLAGDRYAIFPCARPSYARVGIAEIALEGILVPVSVGELRGFSSRDGWWKKGGVGGAKNN